jgi:hypothetical protein
MSNEYTDHEYWASVRSIAKDAWDESEGDIDAAREHARESVEGSAWIIYYPGQLAAIRHCSDEHAGWDELGTAGILEGANTFYDVCEATAYYGFLHDVQEALQTLADEDEDAEGEEDA